MNKIFLYTLLMASLLLPYGCTKQLDKLPDNAKVEGNAITDQSSANIALNGVYFRLANANNSFADWRPNQLMGGLFCGYLGNATGGNGDENNIFANTNYTSQWTRYYGQINAANGLITAVEALPDNKFVNGRKAQILAEAKFLRAYAHFTLLSYFGQWFDINSSFGVINQEEFITLTNKNKPRNTVKDSYDFILKDLDYAVANCPATSVNVYANRWTAMALKMRVLINRGQGDDYAQTAALANTIIAGSPYSLEPNLKDLFYTKGLASTEVILGIKPQANQELVYDNMSANFIGRSAIYAAKPKLVALYENDPRKSWIIGDQYRTSGQDYFIKFVQPTRQSTVISETGYVFRLTEVYLMLVEATVRSGGNLAAAKTLLKEVLSKSGITNYTEIDAANTTDALLKQTYLEYSRNMVGENGIEWMALLRLPSSLITELRPTITNKIQYILPIPMSELQINTAFGPQNPGYAGL